MRSWLLAILPISLIPLFPLSAEAGAGCTDACTSVVGPSCLSLGGLGCRIFPGQTTGQCTNCQIDDDCAPGGNCNAGLCENVQCGGTDGGADPDAAPGEAGTPDTGTPDTGASDTGNDPDAAPGPDTGVVADSGVTPDSGGPRDANPGGRNDPRPVVEKKEKDCSCNATHAAASGSALALGLALLPLLRRRR